jgi:arsenite methyltransferase
MGAAGRSQAIDEAVRVMRAGARLVIADIRAASQYADRLRELDLVDVATRELGWRAWYGGPWMATRAVTARKPPDENHGQSVPSRASIAVSE